jgi:Kef-type K+ transport system membrane component KefB
MVVGLRPDFVLAFVLLNIAVILVAARLVGALALRVGQPRVVGEIVAGVLLGPSLLGAALASWDGSWGFLHCEVSRAWLPVGADPATFAPRAETVTECLFPLQARGVLGIIGQLALVLFMFLVGLEFETKALKGKVKGIVAVSAGVIAAPLALGLAIGPLLHTERFARVGPDGALPDQLGFSLFLAAMLAVTAFPVMVRILQEKGLSTSAMGAIGIAAAAVVTVLMFVMLGLAAGVARGDSAVELSRIVIGTVVYLGVMIFVVRPLLRPLGRRIEADGELDPTEFVTVLVLVLASAYAADRIGINVIVGAFVAGAVMPARALLFRQMTHHLSWVTISVLLPIFLAFSGLRTDFTTLGWAWLPGIALFLVAGIVAKWGGGLLAARAGGLTWAEGNVLGVLMNCRGLLVLVVALVAADQGIITPQMQVGGVLMALVTTAMTGPLFDRFLPAATRGVAVPATEAHTIAEETVVEPT